VDVFIFPRFEHAVFHNVATQLELGDPITLLRRTQRKYLLVALRARRPSDVGIVTLLGMTCEIECDKFPGRLRFHANDTLDTINRRRF
jgi:hypothetical protein